MSRPTVGHLDPWFLQLLDRVQGDLRHAFGTTNAVTLPISATGSAGMETCFANLVEEGDEVVVGVNGVFGKRMAEVASRLGARVRTVERPWGEVFDPQELKDALAACDKPKLLAVVHAETSTGAWQPLDGLSGIAHDAGALFLVDAVTSLSGCPVDVDVNGIDACYSGTQKCLSCPPGLAPVTMSDRAVEAIRARTEKCRSWYLDLTLIGGYFGEGRVYHHTAPVNMIYALAEALAMVREETLEKRFARHEANHRALWAGLSVLGVEPLSVSDRLWMLNAARVPEGVDEAKVRTGLLTRHGIEVGAGLGPFAGKVWRIGLMGASSTRENVRRLLLALAAEFASNDGAEAVRVADDS
jgi:alanine-glyoxylate transaminase/serine-glyoxylate transaminase/serine-pyruvate transaminase